ncbi:MAG TPA: hypothetical protein VN451_05100 [Chitinophagaceae bacterium]|nr:hypothetical protein [Chitinophagaceae bacterium]
MFSIIVFSSSAQNQSIGEGIVKPRIVAGATLYFYTGTLVDELLQQTSPADSLVFRQGEYSIDIATAPPWFVPEAMKLDYDILQLRATTIARTWIEVIVNKQTGKKAWVKREAVEFVGWQDFLLSVFSVELITSANNPLRSKPLDNASQVVNPGRNSLTPHAISGDWMKVSIEGTPGSIPKLGWIRWKKGNQLLITWSLLS